MHLTRGTGVQRCDGVCVLLAVGWLCCQLEREDRLSGVDWGVEGDLPGDEGCLGFEYCFVVSPNVFFFFFDSCYILWEGSFGIADFHF